MRLTASRPTYGPVTVVIVKEPRQECYDLLCQATPLTAPRLIRAWKRRSWIEHYVRIVVRGLPADRASLERRSDACADAAVALALSAGTIPVAFWCRFTRS